MKDLLILVADKDMEMAIKGVLERPEAIGIRKITYDVITHPRHDPGCLSSHNLLRPFSTSYSYTIVIFDHEGCGKENVIRQDLENEVERLLAANGWENDRAKAIVLEPELESWVWSGSAHVRDSIGWKNIQEQVRLRDWLTTKGFLEGEKISRPKEALEAVRRHTRTPKSPSLFYQLAKQVSLKKCIDPSFGKLKETLLMWFPNTI